MNRTTEQWAKVDARAVANGSQAQSENVLKMALQDIASLAAEVATVQEHRRCICQEQHRRGYCREPGCPFSLTSHQEALVSFAEFIRDGYASSDINHVDYRVGAYKAALDVLADVSSSSLTSPHL